ncbi:MAG: hypothetical protein AMS27_06845 [Bacteroides sp. SM23_62_1]|nr:MAG: hypothetical protein AMS27_06845 [Bacteroides sp. SM23_62_1]
MKNILRFVPLLLVLLINLSSYSQGGYNNFKVTVYARAYEVQEMNNLEWLAPVWDEITRQVKVDKIYLETHRDLLLVEKETIEIARKFFEDHGVEVAGGITLTVNERNRFETFCYSNPEHRAKVREIVEYTAGLFDEVILDDFFFTNCKCELCIEQKGDKSWTEYRLALLDEAARELIIKPAKAVNPGVKMVIKYPNWYEHFQGLGFNLETEPPIFDGLYTGTETRDPVMNNQHLQQYHGYLIFRYFENIKPGGNGGGWVDTGGSRFLDRYAEQLWLTLFAGAPEITLFDIRQIQRTLRETDRAPWQDVKPSFNYDEMIQPYTLRDGITITPTTIARAAGYTFEQVDRFLGELGKPVGVKSYKPYHSTGEDFLQTYLGMAGIPMDIVAEFPAEDSIILLTETAKHDPDIVTRIKRQLIDGKDVMITSGLLRALQEKGIKDIAELRYTDRKALVNEFLVGWMGHYISETEIMIPQINYLTNDSWEIISGMDAGLGWPFLHMADYANGTLYVLTIPENFANIYNLPVEVLSEIKRILAKDIFVRLEAPAKVSLFVYDNQTAIVESFLDESVETSLIGDNTFTKMTDLVSGESFAAEKISINMPWGGTAETNEVRFSFSLKPHSYRVFKIE